MYFGGSVLKSYENPQEWLELVKELDYQAVIAPIDYRSSKEDRQDYMSVINDSGLILGEVGAWKNPLDTDENGRKAALAYCKEQLALADELKANCCVNITGARGPKWDGLYASNYSEDVYGMVVDSVREIIDAVKPRNTFYTIEPMPWMVPDSPEAYLKLLKDVDRKGFAVHMDYTNMINSPQRYAFRKNFIEECFWYLMPYIKSVHIKDVVLQDVLPFSVVETPPGTGDIDFSHVLGLCRRLGEDMTVYVEHLSTHEAYKSAIKYVKSVEIN